MKFIRLFSINLFVLIFLLIIIEVILWIFFPIYAPDPSVVKKFLQDIPGVKTEITYSRNDFGLRSLSMNGYSKPDNVIRILCLGASTTDQVTQETRDTWCALIETWLNRMYKDKNGISFQSVAFGRGGLRAIQNAQFAQVNTDNLNPDIVITLLGINDLTWNGGSDYTYQSPKAVLNKKELRASHFFKKFSQIRRRMKIAKRKYWIKIGRVVEWHSKNLPSLRERRQSAPYRATITRDPDPIDEFTESVNWIAEYFVDRGVPLILLGQPVLWNKDMTQQETEALWFSINTPEGPVRPSAEWLQNEIGKYNDVQRRIVLAHHGKQIWYKDLNAVIPKTLDYFFDDCHYTDLGSVTVAKEVLPVVIEAVEAIRSRKTLAN